MAKKIIVLMLIAFIGIAPLLSQQVTEISQTGRECLLMDFGWRFAFGHPYDIEKDYKHASAYFSYFAKVGWSAIGPSGPDFDDSSWRVLDLPHDWVVELPFNERGGHSHGYKAIGRDFPENSIGWYRKTFNMNKADLGKRIKIKFDGVFRHSSVWVNGFYCGEEPSGYSEFQYDITDYVNYGGENIVSVRVDVMMEEGWFYEGAGIYRHVWLIKTDPLHIENNGIFVTSKVNENSAEITANTAIINEGRTDQQFNIKQAILDANSVVVASKVTENLSVETGQSREFTSQIDVNNPKLWSVETPNLYKLQTTISQNDSIIDHKETTFGIRTIYFDPNEGFFLNGKHVLIQGTNNHQDHAGVGVAIPDALQRFRIAQLKKMGSNAYRCSHNPPTPELLDACDQLGMLVLDENRLMGSSPHNFKNLEKMMKRDRNHPCVIAWSIGNEEWGIEGNIKGTRIASTMQRFAKQFDQTRPITVASSGGWGNGVSVPIELMGFNYLRHGNIDEYHKNFPTKPSWGTEESTTQGTRGIYEDNRINGHMAPTDRTQNGGDIETGIKYYAERPFLAGLFFWTGFDYRGEPNPLRFPAISSQFGLLDVCGFPKDPAFYLKAWWTDEPALSISPHWNWEGKEGHEISVWVQSNCDEVELFLNKKSLGRKTMEKYSHLEWNVNYEPGTILAKGYQDGKVIITEKIQTTSEPSKIKLTAHKQQINADGEDISVVTVQVNDSKDRFVPTANQEVTFSIDGPGKIIGVGNGDPACHEPDKVVETYAFERVRNTKACLIGSRTDRSEVLFDYNDSSWPAHTQEVYPPDTTIVIRGTFELPELSDDISVTLFANSMCINQAVYINGHLIVQNVEREAPDQVYKLNNSILKPGQNVYAAIGTPLVKRHRYEDLNIDPGIIQIITPEPTWKRSVFNGLAQVIVQSTKESGKITLKATSPDLSEGQTEIKTTSVQVRPFVP